jgi:hypothetical protein
MKKYIILTTFISLIFQTPLCSMHLFFNLEPVKNFSLLIHRWAKKQNNPQSAALCMKRLLHEAMDVLLDEEGKETDVSREKKAKEISEQLEQPNKEPSIAKPAETKKDQQDKVKKEPNKVTTTEKAKKTTSLDYVYVALSGIGAALVGVSILFYYNNYLN